MTDTKQHSKIIQASGRGTRRGVDAASWVLDGNTGIGEYAEILRLIKDGDPAIEGKVLEPSWLGGIWAGDPTPRSLAGDLGMDPELDAYLLDEACTAYENAASIKFWSEVEGHARRMVEDWT